MSLRKPSCLSVPMASELERTKKLDEYLREAKMFETQEKMDKRKEALDQLQILLQSFIRDVSFNKIKMPSMIADTVGGKLHTFGSYRLGVVNEDTAIDALCLAPSHIRRSDFNINFYQLLKERPQVTELKLVDDNFLKMRFDGIKIKLFFARLPMQQINEDVDLQDVNILQYLDVTCFKNFNACRVTDAILQSIPDIETFRLTLRAIKLWAKRHDIYRHDIGYFGGVPWSIMVAKMCQLFPTDTAVTLIEKFFVVFAKWTWPAPVAIKISFDNSYGFKVWDPRLHVQDFYDLMPIITPSYPHNNSTYSITRSTRDVILYELKMGQSVSQNIMQGGATWSQLFQPTNFFAKYRYFILLVASVQPDQEHEEWFEIVESNLRNFVLIMERNPLIKTLYINPNSFTCCHEDYRDKHHISWILGLDFKISDIRRRDLIEDFKKFEEKVLRKAVYSMAF